jgi:hypothetical protein
MQLILTTATALAPTMSPTPLISTPRRPTVTTEHPLERREVPRRDAALVDHYVDVGGAVGARQPDLDPSLSGDAVVLHAGGDAVAAADVGDRQQLDRALRVERGRRRADEVALLAGHLGDVGVGRVSGRSVRLLPDAPSDDGHRELARLVGDVAQSDAERRRRRLVRRAVGRAGGDPPPRHRQPERSIRSDQVRHRAAVQLADRPGAVLLLVHRAGVLGGREVVAP